MSAGWLYCHDCENEIITYEKTFEFNNFEYIYCKCKKYPVVDGIPIILPENNERLKIINGFMSRKKYKGLKNFLLNSVRTRLKSKTRLVGPSIISIISYVLNKFNPILIPKLLSTFYSKFNIEYPDNFYEYIENIGLGDDFYYLNRYNFQTFRTSYFIISLLELFNSRNDNIKVLDLGGGSGHVSAILSNIFKYESYIADTNFALLYCARLLVPKQNYVMIDANYSMPFKKEFFDLIVNSDMIQSISNQEEFFRNVYNSVTKKGFITGLHCHNIKNQDTFGKTRGFAITYEELERHLSMFKESSIISEKKLYTNMRMKNYVLSDLLFELEEDNTQSEFVFVAAKNNTKLVEFKDPFQLILNRIKTDNNVILKISKIYEKLDKSNKIKLRYPYKQKIEHKTFVNVDLKLGPPLNYNIINPKLNDFNNEELLKLFKLNILSFEFEA